MTDQDQSPANSSRPSPQHRGSAPQPAPARLPAPPDAPKVFRKSENTEYVTDVTPQQIIDNSPPPTPPAEQNGE
jgi:hypothetical protein